MVHLLTDRGPLVISQLTLMWARLYANLGDLNFGIMRRLGIRLGISEYFQQNKKNLGNMVIPTSNYWAKLLCFVDVWHVHKGHQFFNCMGIAKLVGEGWGVAKRLGGEWKGCVSTVRRTCTFWSRFAFLFVSWSSVWKNVVYVCLCVGAVSKFQLCLLVCFFSDSPLAGLQSGQTFRFPGTKVLTTTLYYYSPPGNRLCTIFLLRK